ncbi:phage protease [Helicobacter winghamensis]|uniref:phage protease n=1 Tax=Helicobacter winghamensis TaxID=157268 RepID=UPI0027A6204D
MESLLLELNAQKLQEKVKISPIGAVKGIDGREFKIDGAKLIKIIQDNGIDLALNLNHQVGEAYGWFDHKSLELREDGIYASLELTQKGNELVNSKAFRYLSPEYYTDKEKNVVFLEGLGLVNQPNLLNKALNRIKTFFKERNFMEENLEELQKLAQAAEEKAQSLDDDVNAAQKAAEEGENPNEELSALRKENEELKAQLAELSAKLENALNQTQRELQENHKKRLDLLLQNGDILPARYAKAINMKGQVLEDYLEVCKKEAGIVLGRKDFNFIQQKNSLSLAEAKVFKQLGIKGE